MGTPVVYNQFKLKQHNGNAINLATASIKVMIVSNAYSPSQAHAFKSDVTNEVSGTNYPAGGSAVAGVTVALDGNTVEWIHNDITWAQSAGGFANGRTFIWYEDTGNAGTSKLIMWMQEGSDFGNVVGDLVLDGSATTGVLNVT
jgi:hypothetical protein